MSQFSPRIESLRDLQRASTLGKVRKRLSAYRLHAHFEVLSGKAVRIDATSANPKWDADERAVLERTVESDRCYLIDRGGAKFGLWNTINAKGSSYVCRHLFSDNPNGLEIQASCAMIVCMLILFSTGEKPNRAMEQMVWYYPIGLASLKELEAFMKSRK